MENKKIKPCPFCGATDNPVKQNIRTFYPVGKPMENEYDYFLECDNCNLTIGFDHDSDQWGDRYNDFSTEEEALEIWNKRI